MGSKHTRNLILAHLETATFPRFVEHVDPQAALAHFSGRFPELLIRDFAARLLPRSASMIARLLRPWPPDRRLSYLPLRRETFLIIAPRGSWTVRCSQIVGHAGRASFDVHPTLEDF